MKRARFVLAILCTSVLVVLWSVVDRTLAHCDTMDGPIVPEAQRALDSGDVTPVLKWVRPEDEPAILDVFQRTRLVRDLGPEARQIADRFFLETLIRLHRSGEGEPFTGLKPAGSAPPIFRAADAALESGSVEELASEISTAIHDQIKARFKAALARREQAGTSVEAGRAYVEAYVDYMHFVENVHGFLERGESGHHFGSGGPDALARPGSGDDADR